jgi:hypothetical protein
MMKQREFDIGRGMDAEEVFIFVFHLLVLLAALFLVTVLNIREVGF